jgi:hypothetical protein
MRQRILLRAYQVSSICLLSEPDLVRSGFWLRFKYRRRFTVNTTSFKNSILSNDLPSTKSFSRGCSVRFRSRDKYGMRLSSRVPRGVSIHPVFPGGFAISSLCVVSSSMMVFSTPKASNMWSRSRNAPFESSQLPLSYIDTYTFDGPNSFTRLTTAVFHRLRKMASLFQ